MPTSLSSSSLRNVYGNTIRHLLIGLTALLTNPALLQADVSTRQLPVLSGTEIIELPATSIDDTFILYVRTPPEAAKNPMGKYPVIYALDGDHTFPMFCSIVTELGWSGAVPPAIVVGIGYGTLDLENGNHRNRDLSPQPFAESPDSGGGPAFHSFLIEEVIPHIERKFPADSTKRFLFGHSLGGLFALYAYSKDPDTFNGIIAGSPFLANQLDFLEHAASNHAPRKCKLFVVSGEKEDAVLFLKDLKPLQQKLAENWAQADRYEITILPGFDHFTMVAPSISMGLQYVFE